MSEPHRRACQAGTFKEAHDDAAIRSITTMTRRKIDYSDIAKSSPAQLHAMRRVGRPPIGDERRQMIAIRVDTTILAALRKEARRRRVGYQTLINEVLARHARKDVA